MSFLIAHKSNQGRKWFVNGALYIALTPICTLQQVVLESSASGSLTPRQ